MTKENTVCEVCNSEMKLSRDTEIMVCVKCEHMIFRGDNGRTSAVFVGTTKTKKLEKKIARRDR